ncbi:MAG TPA: exodeoxyribonuclease VII large subunit, partial [Prevotella sp.]
MRKTVTLYELNRFVADTLAASMPGEYWVEAELAEIREVRGHCYMELIQKDPFSNTPVAKASAKCWKNKWQLVRPRFEQVARQPLRAGLKVMLKVYADFHAAYGFAWIVTDIDPAYTLGDMARKRQDIIAALQQQGVFSLQKELTLATFAQRIAVISSPQAAGYGDFCNQLEHNEYGFRFRISLFQAVMQGEGVEQSVIAALDAIHAQINDFDVVVLIRGGGATSDLSGFDTLALAENVA